MPLSLCFVFHMCVPVGSYEEFLEQTSGLNDMDSYPVLMERSKRMGYAVTKVIFRGYHASDQLQVSKPLVLLAGLQYCLSPKNRGGGGGGVQPPRLDRSHFHVLQSIHS